MPLKPQAKTTHESIIHGERLAYCLKRSSRSSIGLSIDHEGLKVQAPLRATIKEIESVLLRHHRWIQQKLNIWKNRSKPEQIDIQNGTTLSLLGETWTIYITPSNVARWQFTSPYRLCLFPSEKTDIYNLLEKALREKARILFTERLARYAPQLGLRPPNLRISSAKKRWGSCSSIGRISLNWRLIFMPLNIVDYVVIHELAHLREMNHSSRFWQHVEELCPEWRKRRLELRQKGMSIPFISN